MFADDDDDDDDEAREAGGGESRPRGPFVCTHSYCVCVCMKRVRLYSHREPWSGRVGMSRVEDPKGWGFF
jgi:hypothetical protein